MSEPDYQKQIDKDFDKIATAYYQLRKEKLGDMTHKEFEKICPQIYISGGSRLHTLGKFANSDSTLDWIQAFAHRYNLSSQPRMNYFLQKYKKERMKVNKIAKKVTKKEDENFSDLEMNLRQGYDAAKGLKGEIKVLREDKRATNLSTKRRELEKQRSQNDNFNLKEMSVSGPKPKRKYEDQDKQKRYDDAYLQFEALLNDPKRKEQIRNLYASSVANQTMKSQYGDSSVKFDGELKPKQLSEIKPGDWEKITNDPRNKWFQAFNSKKAPGFGFNPKMIDPAYAAWQGVRRGTTVYEGDFNQDGYNDIVEIDETGAFRTINGYSRRPSKQGLYIDYFKENKAETNESGNPYYKTDFDDWYVKKVNTMNNSERKKLNVDLVKAGMAKYKVKEASVAEQIESHLKGGIYEKCVKYIAEQIKADSKLVKKNFRIKSLASHIVRAMLHKYFNIDLQKNQKDEEGLISKLTRLVNGKLSKIGRTGRETSYKDDFIEIVKAYCKDDPTIQSIAVAIWNNVVMNDKDKSFDKYVAVQTEVQNEISVNDEELAAACVKAFADSIKDWSERQKTIEDNRHGRYNPMMGKYAE